MNNNTLSLDDTSRIKIVENIDKNFFVVANAGSGKTSILVNRMVAMVESGIDISKICAITFTKAAATEFLDRFQKKLRERENISDNYKALYPGDLGPSSNIKREYCKNALKNINQCFLGTIDAFCNQVLSEYPLDAKIPSSSVVIGEEDEKKAYVEEYTRISIDDKSDIYDSFLAFNTLNKSPEETFSNSIGDIISASSLDIEFEKPTIPFDDEFKRIKSLYEKSLIDDLNELIKCKNYVVDDQSGKKDFKQLFEEFENKINYYIESWDKSNFVDQINRIYKIVKELRFIDLPQTKIISFKFMKNKKVYSYDDDNSILSSLISEIQNIKYKYSIDFLLKVSSQVRKKLRLEGKLTFDEYLLIFREMLINDMKNDMNIIKHIREKHSYYLIDESQDTSPFQTELFLYLTSEVKALKKDECKPIPGSLFILGDPKQSIYRFRGADVPSYLNTKYLFEKVFDNTSNEVLIMTKNFRSTELLIDYFNDIFLDMDNYYQIPKESIVKGTSGLYKYVDYIEVIKEMLNNDKYQVEVKNGDKKELRAPLYKDFMIISKGKEIHDEIIKNLNDNNIPCYVEGSFSIYNTDIIKSIYAIFNYIVNIDNIYYSGALYDLLVSPVFNMKYDQVIGITKSDLPSDIVDYLNKIEELSSIDNPIILYDQILSNIELFKKVDFFNMEYAYFVLEALKNEYSNLNISGLIDSLKFIEKFVSKKQERVMSMDFKPNAVKIANLHKVKGLEAPIVILIKASKGPVMPTIRKDYINNKSFIIQTAKSSYGYNNYNIKTNIFESETELEKFESEKEDERLKYVAVTRARSYLFIDNHGNKNFWSSLVNDSFKEFKANLLQDVILESIDVNNECNSIKTSFNSNDSYEIMSPSKLELQKVNNKYSDSDTDNYNNLDSRLKGTIIHRLMELIVSSNFSINKNDLINLIKSEFNINDDKYINILNNVYDKMFDGGYIQENNKGNDIFSVLRKAKCYCELPFSYKDNEKIWYGNIDLLYELDGKWFIVDYKTNYESNNLDKEYENQLNAYKKALKTICGIDAEAYIYHIG